MQHFPFPMIPLIAIAVIALFLTGLISAGEAAIMRVSKTSLADALSEASHGSGAKNANRARRLRLAQGLAADPSQAVGALAVFRTIVQALAIGSLAIIATKLVPLWWQSLILLALVGIAIGILLARYSPRQFGFRQPLRVLTRLSPMLTQLVGMTRWAALPSAARQVAPEAEAEKYREIVNRVGESPGIEDDERELIKSVFEFRDTLAREVMVPRIEMVTVSATTPLRKLFRLLLRSGYSRVPVTGESVDDVLGIVYLKDVAKAMDDDPLAADRPVSTLLREAQFVPESKPVDDLLREMQAAQNHIAIIVDEYGGIAGLLTVEDIVEELVGELVDEHDSVQYIEPEEVSPGLWRVPSRMPVDELGELFELRLIDHDVDTVGGLLAKALGKVPIAGSTAEIDGLHLAADQIQGRRRQVATVLVSKVAPRPEEPCESDRAGRDATGKTAKR